MKKILSLALIFCASHASSAPPQTYKWGQFSRIHPITFKHDRTLWYSPNHIKNGMAELFRLKFDNEPPKSYPDTTGKKHKTCHCEFNPHTDLLYNTHNKHVLDKTFKYLGEGTEDPNRKIYGATTWAQLKSSNDNRFVYDIANKGNQPAKPKTKKAAAKKHSAYEPLLDKPLAKEEWRWLTKQERSAYYAELKKAEQLRKKNAAQARKEIAAAAQAARKRVNINLGDRAAAQKKYQVLVHNPRTTGKQINELLAKVHAYPAAGKLNEVVLTNTEQAKLSPSDQTAYANTIQKAQRSQDTIAQHHVAAKYRNIIQHSATSTTPPPAANPPVPEKKKEEAWKNALPSELFTKNFLKRKEWDAYTKAIEETDKNTKLSDAEKIKKKNELVQKTLSVLSHADRKLTAEQADQLLKRGGLLDDNDFQKHAICDPLNNRPTTGKVAGKKVTKPLPQLEATAGSSSPKIMDSVSAPTTPPPASTEKPAANRPALTATVPQVPPGPELVDSKSALARKCADASIYAPTGPDSTPAPTPPPKPAINKDARGKLKGAIKTGLIAGGIPGGLIGSFFGPWGVVAGVGIGLVGIGLIKWFSD